jgi:hypothetical protein
MAGVLWTHVTTWPYRPSTSIRLVASGLPGPRTATIVADNRAAIGNARVDSAMVINCMAHPEKNDVFEQRAAILPVQF